MSSQGHWIANRWFILRPCERWVYPKVPSKEGFNLKKRIKASFESQLPQINQCRSGFLTRCSSKNEDGYSGCYSCKKQDKIPKWLKWVVLLINFCKSAHSQMIAIPRQFFPSLFRKGLLFVAYSVIFSVSLILAFEFRDSFRISEVTVQLVRDSLFWVVGIKLLSLTCFRQFRGLLSYFRLPDVYRLAAALALPGALLLTASFYSNYGLLASALDQRFGDLTR